MCFFPNKEFKVWCKKYLNLLLIFIVYYDKKHKFFKKETVSSSKVFNPAGKYLMMFFV